MPRRHKQQSRTKKPTDPSLHPATLLPGTVYPAHQQPDISPALEDQVSGTPAEADRGLLVALKQGAAFLKKSGAKNFG
jgi:hypothetical protein